MNLADMYADELQQVARIAHKALGWDMIQPEQAIYARDMVQELADAYAKLKAFNELTEDEKNKAFESTKKWMFTNHFPNKRNTNEPKADSTTATR